MTWSRCETQPSDADSCLEALLIKGLTTGGDIPLSPDFWTELKQEATILAIRVGDSGIPARLPQQIVLRHAPGSVCAPPEFFWPEDL